MRFKSLLIVITGLLLAAGTFFYASLKQNATNPEEKTHIAIPQKGIRGAIEYYNYLKADPATGIIDPAIVKHARDGYKNMSKSKALNILWQEMGPSNVGGRTRAILIDKDNPAVMYAGGVSGGLWKSTTSGQSWVQIPLSDNMAVSCIAQSPVDGTIYVGTGEGLANAAGTNFNSGQLGGGLYRSTDGVTFTLLPLTKNYTLINRVGVDSQGKVFLGTAAGLKISSDKGDTWSNSQAGPVKDIKISLATNTIIFSINGAVYIGNTTTETWTQNMPATGATRAEVAFAPSNDSIMYAVFASNSNVASYKDFLGIYRTSDRGANWEQIAPGGTQTFGLFGPNNQGWYDIAVLVSPTNPNMIFVGGISLWKGQRIQSNAPFSWTLISSTNDFYGDGTPNPHYVHADIHALVQNPSNPAGFFVGSDGGISETANNGISFVTKNINYAVTQYYAVACSPTGWAAGGTQDNSTPYVDGTGNNLKEARVLYYGDGGWAAFSSLAQKVIFATSQNGNIGRSNDNGVAWQFPTAANGSTPDFFNAAMINAQVHELSAFVTPLLLWETTNFPNPAEKVIYTADTNYQAGDTVWAASIVADRYPFKTVLNQNLDKDSSILVDDPIESRLFIGAKNGVYMTDQALYYTGFPPRWYKVASINGTVWTMSISRDGDVLYFASGNVLYRISNLLSAQDSSTLDYGSTAYALQQTSVKTFAGTISSIAIDPADANRVVVTLGGFSNSYDHVWYSTNATSANPTFVSKSGDLPDDLPVYASLIPINNSNTLILGTEFGIVATENLNSASPTYVAQNDGLDDFVPVFMLRQQVYEQPYIVSGRWDNGNFVTQVYPGIYNFGEIYAATHGRGLFKSLSYVGFKEIESHVGKFNTNTKVYPNPATDVVTIEFELDKNADIRGAIFDNSGRMIRKINLGNCHSGINKHSIDISDLSKGFYVVVINNGVDSKSSKLIIQ